MRRMHRGGSNGTNPDGIRILMAGAPSGVTDLKAGCKTIWMKNDREMVRQTRTGIFLFGHSGGGAQSALLGALPEYSSGKVYALSVFPLGKIICEG